MLIGNWIVGPVFLVTSWPFYVARLHAEEQMMVDEFGEEYKEYRKRTGRIIPKFGRICDAN
jgi:protein-S-isoprenylcysteine O-methyltransferase Ste14